MLNWLEIDLQPASSIIRIVKGPGATVWVVVLVLQEQQNGDEREHQQGSTKGQAKRHGPLKRVPSAGGVNRLPNLMCIRRTPPQRLYRPSHCVLPMVPLDQSI